MSTASEVLLIIVSAVLAVFLIVLIVGLAYIIKILKQVRRVMDRAENVVDSVEAGASAFKRTASPLAVLKVIGNILEQASRIKKGKG